jgi:methyl-accepting chemotaxis protein
MAVGIGFRNQNLDRVQMDIGNRADQIDGAFIKEFAVRVWGRIVEWIVRGYEAITDLFTRIIEFYRPKAPKNDRLIELSQRSLELSAQMENRAQIISDGLQEISNGLQEVSGEPEEREIRLQRMSTALTNMQDRFRAMQRSVEDRGLALAAI